MECQLIPRLSLQAFTIIYGVPPQDQPARQQNRHLRHRHGRRQDNLLRHHNKRLHFRVLASHFPNLIVQLPGRHHSRHSKHLHLAESLDRPRRAPPHQYPPKARPRSAKGGLRRIIAIQYIFHPAIAIAIRANNAASATSTNRLRPPPRRPAAPQPGPPTSPRGSLVRSPPSTPSYRGLPPARLRRPVRPQSSTSWHPAAPGDLQPQHRRARPLPSRFGSKRSAAHWGRRARTKRRWS